MNNGGLLHGILGSLALVDLQSYISEKKILKLCQFDKNKSDETSFQRYQTDVGVFKTFAIFVDFNSTFDTHASKITPNL